MHKSIYTPPSLFAKKDSYMRCGKRDKAPCNSNDECSFKECDEIYGVCQLYTNGPSDSDGCSIILPILFSIVLTIILFVICYCIIRCYKHSKK